uniref:Beclin 1, autophagy related n=1 Tax=Eptatretus burgeri TaxID=7764 RepID=A0A8C4N162_EPTBU
MNMEGSTSMANVSFVCQRCGQPLKLDTSFNTLDTITIAELSAPLVTITPASTDYVAEGNRKEVRLNINYKQPFCSVMLNFVAMEFKVTSALFDVMSGQTDVDHPLCEECTDALLDQMDQQLKVSEDECRDYREFLERLEQESVGGRAGDESEAKLQEELGSLRREEASLVAQLVTVEAQRKQVGEELERLRQESRQLDEREARYQREYGEFKRQLLECEDEQRSADNQIRYAQMQLDKFKKTNVFNATFHIWHSGHFGTINNFRLGRLPSVPVEWSEINAAWGQTVLYHLVPFGNHSYLESLLDKSKELPLYGSGGFRFFWDSKFDQAMVAFLDCLQQFKVEVEKGDTGFCLPYNLESKAGCQTIKSLRYVLRDCTDLVWQMS